MIPVPLCAAFLFIIAEGYMAEGYALLGFFMILLFGLVTLGDAVYRLTKKHYREGFLRMIVALFLLFVAFAAFLALT